MWCGTLGIRINMRTAQSERAEQRHITGSQANSYTNSCVRITRIMLDPDSDRQLKRRWQVRFVIVSADRLCVAFTVELN